MRDIIIFRVNPVEELVVLRNSHQPQEGIGRLMYDTNDGETTHHGKGQDEQEHQGQTSSAVKTWRRCSRVVRPEVRCTQSMILPERGALLRQAPDWQTVRGALPRYRDEIPAAPADQAI